MGLDRGYLEVIGELSGEVGGFAVREAADAKPCLLAIWHHIDTREPIGYGVAGRLMGLQATEILWIIRRQLELGEAIAKRLHIGSNGLQHGLVCITQQLIGFGFQPFQSVDVPLSRNSRRLNSLLSTLLSTSPLASFLLLGA